MNENLICSFSSSILFVFGMLGYIVIDSIDLFSPSLIEPTKMNGIYVFLGSVFVLNAGLNISVFVSTRQEPKTRRIGLTSLVFDQVASFVYLFGATFLLLERSSTKLVWTLNAIGIFLFFIGATLNLFLWSSSKILIVSDLLNFVASSIYLVSIIFRRILIVQILVLVGDSVYLVCSILYTISLFENRTENENISHDRDFLIDEND